MIQISDYSVIQLSDTNKVVILPFLYIFNSKGDFSMPVKWEAEFDAHLITLKGNNF